jgi:hypothetical protein
MSFRFVSQASLCLCCSAILFVGCKEKVNLIPVTGTLTIDGQPAADINVQFMPDIESKNVGPTSFGATNAEGKFELKTFTNEVGAVPGAHRVILSDLNEERPAQGEAPTRPPRLKSSYGTAVGGLRVMVEKDKPVVLEATSK